MDSLNDCPVVCAEYPVAYAEPIDLSISLEL